MASNVDKSEAVEVTTDEADLSELTRDAFHKVGEYLNGELEGRYTDVRFQ